MRPEIEVSLALQTEQEWLRIWQSLGFETVATVEKTRRPFRIQAGHGSVVVTLDQVAGIGAFAEIERVVNIPSELEPAQLDIQQTALRLGLEFVEKRSYLSMVLEQLR
jgi:predicted adenylyl cyclase CyaB